MQKWLHNLITIHYVFGQFCFVYIIIYFYKNNNFLCFNYREITLEVLGQEPVGAFMVRESTTKPGCFALSLRVPQEFHSLGIAHYLILRTNKGFKIKVNIIQICRCVSAKYQS